MASVKVAVRVRPMNKREKDMDAKCIIKMDKMKTTIYSEPGELGDKKEFSFDHSYWSVSSADSHFASQEMVFKDLGVDVIDAAFEGYNACIFAYGQTGAGKSYSMMGAKDAPGLIPRICEGLYERMNVNPTDKIEYRTEVSYLEIYNERVADLLRPPGKNKDAYHSLKVREHPKEGPYVQELTKHMVKDYKGIEGLMEIGNNNRTVASTNMNDVSSRSHAIFTITFTQAKFFTDMPSETLSRINLVDLAGSERADSTGATGHRLKEGANINKSLVTLGTVISALAEASQMSAERGGKKQLFIPYRNSTLTWLLKDSLGGNSKTIMIAAISPADVNHPETLSTLRYANRAKNIVNKPTVNEDPNVRLIRELRSEIDQLRNLLKSRPEVMSPGAMDNEESTRLLMTEKLHENEVKVEELVRSWTSRWKETQTILEERALSFSNEGIGVKLESELPHLVCMDNDLLSTSVTLYHLKDGKTHVGRADARTKQDIVLHGPGIVSEHCIMECLDVNTILHPLGPLCAVNGELVTKSVKLKQGDVMLLGKTHMFRFNHPAQAAKLREKRIYESVENLAEMGENDNERPPSYLFYNAGLELERQYQEETRRLDQMRGELEKQQAEAKNRLSEAKDELESIQVQQREAEMNRQVKDEERKKEIEERQKKLEQQERYMEELQKEQEKAREQAEKEIQDVKMGLEKEQELERQKLNAELKRIAELEEEQRKIVEDKEKEIKKIKDELARKWEEERKQVEQQRKEVEKLQREFEEKRKSFHLEVEVMQQKSKSVPDIPKEVEKERLREGSKDTDSPHIEMQRERLKRLEDEYEEERLIAQREIADAREGVRCAEQETLHGMRSLTSGKTQIEDQWARLEQLQYKHKKTQEEMINKIKDTRERLEIAEEAEEAALIEKERVIMERRATRIKVEEAKRKLQEMEAEGKTVELSEADFTKKKESLEMETREEIKDIREERRILMELLGKHQSALAKATQMVTETKTKLEKHLENEKLVVIPQRDKVENTVRHELGPLIDSEQDIERRCEEADRESRERKKVIYKQRRRIALLERQHTQSLQQAEKETLNKEELEELENEREAEKSLIRKEKVRLLELEKWHKEQQEVAELTIGELVQDLEKRKELVNDRLDQERMKLQEIESVHKETLEHVEAELENRTEILHRVKDKVLADKRQLAKLDLRQQRCAAKAAEELFLVIDVLEKEMEDKGKTDELQKIRDHRKKLQDLDRQMRWADKKERQLRGSEDGGPCTLY